jgi:hypothetical protein
MLAFNSSSREGNLITEEKNLTQYEKESRTFELRQRGFTEHLNLFWLDHHTNLIADKD